MIYAIEAGMIYRCERSRINANDWQRILPHDDEYWTAIEWLTDTGWL